MRALALATLLLSTSANAAPFFIVPGRNETSFTPFLARADPVAQLLSIMPSAESCVGDLFLSECTTASAAVGPLIAAFNNYQIITAPEQAAIISWQAFESGELKFNQNHFPAPGRLGQGTRAMLMPNFVAEYAASIPQIAFQTSGKDLAGILALVQPDEFSFGSAAWFYSTQCSQSVKQGVQTGRKAGWEQFITGCVQTTIDDSGGDKSRTAYWERAMQAFGCIYNLIRRGIGGFIA